MPSSTSEPSGVPETTAESSAEPGSEPEPEGSAPNAEPVPEWPAASVTWGVAWELHYIGLAVLFFALALWAIFSLIRARKRALLVTRRFCYSVNWLLIALGTSRGLVLLIYPYEMVAHARGTPVVLGRLLFGIGFPCLSAGFTMIHFAFLEVVKIRYHTKHIQTLRFTIGVLAVHFLLESVSQITAAYVKQAGVLLIICMFYFIILALVMSVSMMYSGFKVININKVNRRTLRKLSRRAGNPRAEQQTTTSNTRKVARVTVVTAFLGLACAAAQLYALVCVFKVMHGPGAPPPPQPWPWWSYQTVFRLIELALAATIAYTVAQPKKRKEKGKYGCKSCCGLITRRGNYSTDVVLSNTGQTKTDSTHIQQHSIVIRNTDKLVNNEENNERLH